jgi:hypothetical protein
VHRPEVLEAGRVEGEGLGEPPGVEVVAAVEVVTLETVRAASSKSTVRHPVDLAPREAGATTNPPEEQALPTVKLLGNNLN